MGKSFLLHQQDQQNNDRKEDANDKENDGKEPAADEATTENGETTDNDAYNNLVTMLYGMVGYNVPAEEESDLQLESVTKGVICNRKRTSFAGVGLPTHKKT